MGSLLRYTGGVLVTQYLARTEGLCKQLEEGRDAAGKRHKGPRGSSYQKTLRREGKRSHYGLTIWYPNTSC